MRGIDVRQAKFSFHERQKEFIGQPNE